MVLREEGTPLAREDPATNGNGSTGTRLASEDGSALVIPKKVMVLAFWETEDGEPEAST